MMTAPASCARSMFCKVHAIERSFAQAEDQRAALFQANVGGAREQIFAGAIGNRSERARGAWDNDHAVHGVAAGSDGCADVAVGEQFGFLRARAAEKRGKLLRVGGDNAQVPAQGGAGPLRDDEVDARNALRQLRACAARCGRAPLLMLR